MSENTTALEKPLETVWSERLAEVKQQEKPEAVLLLAEDQELIRIAVAWTNTSTSCPRKFTRPPLSNDPHAWWEWLWQNRVYSRQEVIEKAAYSELRFDKKFRTLVGNRAIYPDGTVNSYVQRYLREKFLKLFQTKTKRANPKEPPTS